MTGDAQQHFSSSSALRSLGMKIFLLVLIAGGIAALSTYLVRNKRLFFLKRVNSRGQEAAAADDATVVLIDQVSRAAETKEDDNTNKEHTRTNAAPSSSPTGKKGDDDHPKNDDDITTIRESPSVSSDFIETISRDDGLYKASPESTIKNQFKTSSSSLKPTTTTSTPLMSTYKEVVMSSSALDGTYPTAPTLVEQPRKDVELGIWIPNINLCTNVHLQDPNAFVEDRIQAMAPDPFQQGLSDPCFRGTACPITIYTLGFKGYPLVPGQKLASQNDPLYYWDEPLLSAYQEFDLVGKPA